MSTNREENEGFDEKYAGKDIVAVVKGMATIQAEKEAAEERLKGINKEFDYLRLNLIPRLCEDLGVENLKVDGVGRLSLTADMYVSIPAGKKEEALQWFDDIGKGDIIKRDINSSTLKATIKAMIKNGDDVNPDFVKYTPFTRASITRK